MHRSIEIRNAARNPESGNTMVVVLLVLFLLTSLGISYIAVTKGDKQIAGNQMISSQAFENAEAGISEVLLRMSDPHAPGNTYLGEQAGAYTPGWGRYVVTDPGNAGMDPDYADTQNDGLDNDGDAAVDEASERYPEKGSKQNLGMALSNKLDYPWVKVRYKLNGTNQIILFGDHDNNPTTPPQENLIRGIPKIIITAAGRRGVANKIVTVEALKWPLPPIVGSVYTESPMSFSGNAFYMDGHDHDYTAPYDTIAGAPSLPGIATPNDPTTITNNITGQQSDNVQGSGSDPSVQASPVNLDVQALATAWSMMADITLAGDQNNPASGGWGTVATDPPDLKVVHIQGDLDISGNMSGAGVLVIDGDFKMGGTINWSGIVLVLGDVDVVGGGNAKNIVGGLVVQGTLAGETTVNGNITTYYSSAMIAKLNALKDYEVSSWIDQ
ncbi:MAG TPA: PilX N-terminal domain-containing pilus assembly protein [Candidatus Eisenbacteria bacterium]|nr:PilX N-terminal domain-containing pilus assembly protein [Candidatus Eisenbacteria bacterium]